MFKLPKPIQPEKENTKASERLSRPLTQADSGNDLAIFRSYRNSLQQNYEQLLPDFYCEHITLAMNKERRKQALEKLLQLFKQDIERENKSKNGLKKLTQAITQTPNFGNDDSQQNVSEKIYHMESMLMYLEGAKYKVQNALTELDGKRKIDHPLASYIIVMRDKSVLQQSTLKVPQWLKDQMIKPENTSENKIPVDRTKADGSSDESDFDFSEEISIVDIPLQPIAQCKALYTYKRNLDDELCLHPGDVLSVYRKQEDGWWLGECKGSVGIFPATYVEIIQT
ncbi:hypothetical protein FQR65_LT06037 [Abscondita terminalis]|nr:hypothetical protein FQR65_LT06037 [Abscondita terminalis]